MLTPSSFRDVAGFISLRRPLRMCEYELVRAPDDFWLICTPDPTTKFSRARYHAALPVALAAIEDAWRGCRHRR